MMVARRKVRAPFPYFGGKQYLLPDLLPLVPPHDVYVEVFGGSASLLFGKPPSGLEVYNDLDSGLVNFFRVLRDPLLVARLKADLELTLYSREEWAECLATWRDVADPVERARRWYVSLVQSFSKTPDAHGWSYCKQLDGHAVSKFRGLVAQLSACAKRFALVQVEHLDALDCIARYDAPNVLFYVDPPYLPETRKAHGYHHEMTRAQHVALLEQLRTSTGKMLLSGYHSALYDEMLHDWRRIDRPTVNWSSNGAREARMECIWVSPNAGQRSLWD